MRAPLAPRGVGASRGGAHSLGRKARVGVGSRPIALVPLRCYGERSERDRVVVVGGRLAIVPALRSREVGRGGRIFWVRAQDVQPGAGLALQTEFLLVFLEDRIAFVLERLGEQGVELRPAQLRVLAFLWGVFAARFARARRAAPVAPRHDVRATPVGVGTRVVAFLRAYAFEHLVLVRGVKKPKLWVLPGFEKCQMFCNVITWRLLNAMV